MPWRSVERFFTCDATELGHWEVGFHAFGGRATLATTKFCRCDCHFIYRGVASSAVSNFDKRECKLVHVGLSGESLHQQSILLPLLQSAPAMWCIPSPTHYSFRPKIRSSTSSCVIFAFACTIYSSLWVEQNVIPIGSTGLVHVRRLSFINLTQVLQFLPHLLCEVFTIYLHSKVDLASLVGAPGVSQLKEIGAWCCCMHVVWGRYDRLSFSFKAFLNR